MRTKENYHMNWLEIVFTVLAVVVVILVLLVLLGRHLQKKQAATMEQVEQNRQTVPALIIDKKKMKLKAAPFPAEVYEKTPIYLRHLSVYVVKAKIGPKIVNLMCEKNVFEQIPLKVTIQGKISGAYLTEITKGAVPTEKMIETRRKEKAKAEKKAAKNK